MYSYSLLLFQTLDLYDLDDLLKWIRVEYDDYENEKLHQKCFYSFLSSKVQENPDTLSEHSVEEEMKKCSLISINGINQNISYEIF